MIAESSRPSGGLGPPEGRSRAARRETAVALMGLALIGAHVVDDNFLQPEPELSASRWEPARPSTTRWP